MYLSRLSAVICQCHLHDMQHVLDQPTCSVPLRTGTSYIIDIFVLLFARLLCSAGITNENEFHNSSSPTLCASNDITSAMPTHSVRKYGFFSESARRRQVAKYSNLKRCESLSFFGDIEGLEPSKF